MSHYRTLISADQLLELRASNADLVLLDCRFDLANTSAGEAAYAHNLPYPRATPPAPRAGRRPR